MPGTTYHRDNLREDLLDAALAELREKGSGAFSIRNVASRCGVSHNAPYRHFDSKERLLDELAREGFSGLVKALERSVRPAAGQSRGGRAADRLVALLRAYLGFAEKNPELVDLMFSSEASIGSSPSEGGTCPAAEAFGILERCVADCQAEGSVASGASSGALALVAWSTIHGFSVLAKRGIVGAMGESRGGSRESTVRAVFDAMRALWGGGA